MPNKIVKLLSTHSDLHHPQPLCRIDLAQTKSYLRRHALSLILKSSQRDDTVLFRLDLGSVKQSFGEASLLDSLAYLSVHDYRTVHLESYLSYSPPNIDSPEPIFRLHVSISLLNSFFASGYSGPKQLFLDWLIPPPPFPSGAEQGETTVDYFYARLGRAPKTFRGLPIDDVLERELPAQVEIETEESKRKKLKGKGKASEYDHHLHLRKENKVGNHEGEEDKLLKPVGLVPELMPFQSRSVRWLLAREGKMVVPTPLEEARKDQVRPTASSSILPLGEKPNGVTVNSHLEEEHHQLLSDDQMDVERLSDAGSSSDDDDPFSHASPIILAELPPPQMLSMTRGPFWEQVPLKHPDGSTKVYWYNRVEGSLRKEDPALREDRMAGFGQGLLCEEMGCGKTVEIISLILLRACSFLYASLCWVFGMRLIFDAGFGRSSTGENLASYVYE